MIIKLLLNLLKGLLDLILNLFDVLPSLPDGVIESINNYVTLIIQNSKVVSFFIPVEFCLTLVAIVLVIENFHYIYKFTLWLLRKIPFVGIE